MFGGQAPHSLRGLHYYYYYYHYYFYHCHYHYHLSRYLTACSVLRLLEPGGQKPCRQKVELAFRNSEQQYIVFDVCFLAQETLRQSKGNCVLLLSRPAYDGTMVELN